MSELRYNYLKDTWVIISPERAMRPHDYNVSIYEEEIDLKKCPFEYGNEDKTPPEIFSIRNDNSLPNTPGWKVRVVPNKYPALRIENNPDREGYLIFEKISGFGAHEVIVDTPDHFKHIQDFSEEDFYYMLLAFRERASALYRDLRIKYVHIFKNHGKEAGKSIVHSHSQIIALPIIPKLQKTMLIQAKKYYLEKERCYLCDEINAEIEVGKRVLYQNDSFISYCPYSSLFPFEIKIAPKFHGHDFTSITDQEIKNLSEVLQYSVRKLHKTLINPPFNLVFYTSPPIRSSLVDEYIYKGLDIYFHWHIEILPRITTLAGFELGTDYYINHTPPEEAVKYLIEVV